MEIRQLALSQLTHFVDASDRVELAGPPCRLGPAAAQAIGMALHELATNAVKHGALSTRGGRVTVSWNLPDAPPQRPSFALEWRETGGPTVRQPTRTGFGHLVIGQMIEQALAGKAQLDFAESGLVWSFRGPADQVLEKQGEAVPAL